MNYQNLPSGAAAVFNVIIEIPRGSQNKYEYLEKFETFVLERVLKDGFNFIADYGFIPHTKGGDGDPLDVFVITPYPLTQGVVVACQAVGMIELFDNGEQDNKIIAVPYIEGKKLSEVVIDDEFKKGFVDFFAELARQKNKTMKIVAWHDAVRAEEEINRGIIK